MYTKASTHNHNSCGTCSKKLVKHKKSIACFTCSNRYYPKCVELTSSDVNLLISTNELQTWICIHCSSSIFPQYYVDGHYKNEKMDLPTHTAKTHEICKTCNKLGNMLLSCE